MCPRFEPQHFDKMVDSWYFSFKNTDLELPRIRNLYTKFAAYILHKIAQSGSLLVVLIFLLVRLNKL